MTHDESHQGFIQDFLLWGGGVGDFVMLGTFRGASHRNNAFRDYRVELTNFNSGSAMQFIQDFVLGGGEGGDVWEVVSRADIGMVD